MNDQARRIHAIAVFELRQRLRSTATVLGLAAFAAILAVGHWAYWKALPPRPDDDRLFGYAFIAGLAISLRIGLAADRETAFDSFLVGNFVTPACYLAGKLGAAATQILGFGAFALVAALALGAGDWAYAAWYTAFYTLIAWTFLPAVATVELVSTIRQPVAVVAVAFVVAIVTLDAFIGVQTVSRALGLAARRLEFPMLGPLMLRALASTAILALLYPFARWRLGPRPRTRGDGSPSLHGVPRGPVG